MHRTEHTCFRWLPVCPMSSHETNPFVANCVFPRKHVHRYALCFGVVCATYFSWPTSNTALARNPLLRLLENHATLHAYSGADASRLHNKTSFNTEQTLEVAESIDHSSECMKKRSWNVFNKVDLMETLISWVVCRTLFLLLRVFTQKLWIFLLCK